MFAGVFVLSVTGPLILFFLSLAALKHAVANLETGSWSEWKAYQKILGCRAFIMLGRGQGRYVSSF